MPRNTPNSDKYGNTVHRNSVVMFNGGATARVLNVRSGKFRTVVTPNAVHYCYKIEVLIIPTVDKNQHTQL